jgi:hypothetical protein
MSREAHLDARTPRSAPDILLSIFLQRDDLGFRVCFSDCHIHDPLLETVERSSPLSSPSSLRQHIPVCLHRDFGHFSFFRTERTWGLSIVTDPAEGPIALRRNCVRNGSNQVRMKDRGVRSSTAQITTGREKDGF